jgi:SAM-dependent methyltransferase
MTDAALGRFYPDTYWGGAEPSLGWIHASQAEKTRFVAACGLGHGRVLDVGCGSGLFLQALDERRWHRAGVETGPVAAELARRSLGRDRVFTGTLIEARAAGWLTAADERFDLVTLWSALEHMNRPRENLIEVHRRLGPGGTLIVQVPNIACYQARWFKGAWFALDAPRHRHHFDAETLARLLTETGFSIYRQTHFSESHNVHALRQSLKTRLRSSVGRVIARPLFLVSIPFLMPLDYIMSAMGSGATLTVAARAI